MKKIIASLIIIASTLTTFNAQADSIELTIGLQTNHLDDFTGYNEDNDLIGLGYKFESNDFGVMVAKFNNSYYNDTIALGLTYDVFKTDYFTVDILAGAVKGYTSKDLGDIACPFGDSSDICLFVAPRASLTILEVNNAKVKLSAMLFGTALITTIGFEYKF